MGSGIKEATMIESLSIPKKSIFCKIQNLRRNYFRVTNVTIKGPKLGLMPKYLDLILGKKLQKILLWIAQLHGMISLTLKIN